MNKLLDLELRSESVEVLNKHTDTIKLLNVDHLGYREFYEDGSSMAFCSNKAWYEVVLNNEMFRDMSLHYALELLSISRKNYKCIIRTASNANNRFLKELLKSDLCNSLLFYKREKHIIKMYSFIATLSNGAALTHLVNNQPLIESVISSYKDELENIFKKDKYLPLRQNLFKGGLVNDIFNHEDHKKRISSPHDLTPRELEYVQLLAQGATNKELAATFKITPRAAHYNVKNIKKKLKVATRSDIMKMSKTIS